MDFQNFSALAAAARGDVPAELVLRGGNVVNVFTGEIIKTSVAVTNGTIVGIGDQYVGEQEIDLTGKYLCPGFIDGHIHLESTMVTPSELVEQAVKCGTTTYIVDPHEAANVSGAAGIDYILDETEDVPANVYVMMPSCVPSLPFEDNGCTFDAKEMQKYLANPRVLGLGEVMDYVSTVSAAPAMAEKLALFDGRPKDGHAPGLSGNELNAYVLAGITNDHECSSFDEVMEKRRLGMHIHVREGSAARNLEPIVKGIVENGQDVSGFSFCTDDKHIEDIHTEGHIDHCIRKAIACGMKPVDAIRMATIHTAQQYGLQHQLGAIAPGMQADFVVLDDLEAVAVSRVFHSGADVSGFHAQPKLPMDSPLRQTVHCLPVQPEQLQVPVGDTSPVIRVIPNEIVTGHDTARLPQQNGLFVPNGEYSKIAVVERHHNTGKVGVGAVSGFGIRGGAIASTVAHDSHNLSVIGDNDGDMLLAIEHLRKIGGGYTLVENGNILYTVPLPIMGLMSDAGFDNVQTELSAMIVKAHEMGVPEGVSPLILLSFLALPVIPSLRITPRGLFDVEQMQFISL
ncbi:adenine deaminase [Butyricicoccus sp.]|uniref:adenine deaminase n=1 Tax=Butyricicoccus sp. TaxID=2049021 RepID=UPI003F1687C0